MTYSEDAGTGIDAWTRRTVGELRAAVAAGAVAKSELQLYGLDWSQIEREPDDAILADVFARHGAVPDTTRRDADEGTGVLKTPM